MLYPEVPGWRQVLAFAGCYGAAVPLGLWCYALLEPLRRRGRFGRFVAQFWAWWVAVAIGSWVAVWIGGLWIFAGPGKWGGLPHTDPMTRGELTGMATVMAAAYATFGLFSPMPEGEQAAEPRTRRSRKRKPFTRRKRSRRRT